jgi:hypothetical protein
MIHTLQEELSTTCGAADPQDMKVDLLPNNHLVCLQNVCVSNQSSNNMRVQVGVIVGASVMWITMIECASDQKYYSWTGEVYFRSCKSVILRCVNVNNGDAIEGYVYGYYLD